MWQHEIILNPRSKKSERVGASMLITGTHERGSLLRTEHIHIVSFRNSYPNSAGRPEQILREIESRGYDLE